MSRLKYNQNYDHVFAIVRIDDDRFTVKKVVWSAKEAKLEVDRLNSLGIAHYEFQITRVSKGENQKGFGMGLFTLLKDRPHFPAKGTRGFLMRSLDGDCFFRVYNDDVFIDYKVTNHDLEVEIVDDFAEIYEGLTHDGEYDGYLDYSQEVLGN